MNARVDDGQADALLTVAEARELLGIGRNTIYRLLRTGQIPGARRVGHQWRVHRQTLVDWLSCKSLAPRKPKRNP